MGVESVMRVRLSAILQSVVSDATVRVLDAGRCLHQ